MIHWCWRWSSCGVGRNWCLFWKELHPKQQIKSTTMTVKTVASYTCAIFSVIVLILCLCTNYWIQYETAHTRNGKTTRYRIRAGLWEYCRNIKEHTETKYGPTKCFPVNGEKDKNLGISMGEYKAYHISRSGKWWSKKELWSLLGPETGLSLNYRAKVCGLFKLIHVVTRHHRRRR